MTGTGKHPLELATDDSDSRDAVSALLLDGRVDAAAVGGLIEAGLASRTLRALPDAGIASLAGAAGKEIRSELGRSRLTALAAHAAVRSAVGPLLRAWRLADLDVLVFKGFHLAENVYEEAADRAYSDVDVALRPGISTAGMEAEELALMASRVASQTGWHVVWRYGEEAAAASLHDERYDGHELLQLVHRRIGIGLDVHRRLVHNNVNVARAAASAETITAAVWEAADTAVVAGVQVRVPMHLDSALVGLIAARSWSSDRHGIRPHDYLDLEQLMTAGMFGREDVLLRARQLGMYRTARSFLRRCDPSERVLKVTPPSRAERLMLDLVMLPERWPRGLALAWRRFERLAAEVRAASKVVGVVRTVVRDHRSRKPVRIAEPQGPDFTLEPDRRNWMEIVVGVRRALQLFGIEPSVQPELAIDCLIAVVRRERLAVAVIRRAGMVSFECGGTPLPLKLLGTPVGATRTRWPAKANRLHHVRAA